MTNQDLKSFKISDQTKQPVDRPKSKAGKAEPAAPPSVGFPRIEAVVESGDLGGLSERLATLQEMARSGSNKDKLAAKKAAAAYERASALLGYLLDTKVRLAGG
jgi:hypothetical protein